MHDPWERFLPKLQLQKARPITLQGTNAPWNSKTFKYDAILTFLDDLESGELEQRCSDQDLEHMNQFIADLAREGHIPTLGGDPQELEQDIEELLGISDPYAFRYAPAERSSYELTPALDYGDHEVLQCGWFKKAWKKTKKFCKKHKKAIIIGAVFVVAVTTIVVVAVAASSSAAAGGAAAAAGGAEGGGAVGAGGGAAAVAGAAAASSSNKSDDRPSTTSGINDAIASRPSPMPPAPPQSPKSKSSEVEQIVERHIQNFKEVMAEESPAIDLARPHEPLPFEEAARVHGAYAARAAATEVVGPLPDVAAPAPPLAEIDNAFGILSANIAPVKTALAAGRLAHRVPGGPGVQAAAGATAYAIYNPDGAQNAYNAVCEGASYVADKALEGVTYVKDRVIEATDAVVSWATGAQPITSLESRSGAGVVDDRVLRGDSPNPLTPERIQDIVAKSDEIRKGDRTHAGRAWDKHGNRPGTIYPTPTGSAEDINRGGREIVEDILTDPGSRIDKEGNKFGGQDIRAPDGRGIRLDSNDQLRGFLQPDPSPKDKNEPRK